MVKPEQGWSKGAVSSGGGEMGRRDGEEAWGGRMGKEGRRREKEEGRGREEEGGGGGRRKGGWNVNPGGRQQAQGGAEGPEGLSGETPRLRDGGGSRESPGFVSN